MELVKLEINGFRGFESKQIIKFPSNNQPIVFVGINGAGKTSILDAIVLGLRPFYDALIVRDRPKTEISHYNINVDKKKMEIQLDWKYPIESREQRYTTTQQANLWDDKITQKKPSEAVLNLCSDIKSNISLYKNQYSLGLTVYYPSNRLAPRPNVGNPTNPLTGHLSALAKASASGINFQSFFEWFRWTEDIENEKRLTDDPEYKEPKLQAVKNAILAFLDDFSEIRIQRFPLVDMMVKKGNQKLSVNQLSSGEKSILTMVGDLARRLAIANPGMPNPLNGRAVVLIDEIDLHLHPRWQKNIVAKLQETFPNVQFVLTTHSPLIINHLKTESIYLLDNFECTPATQTNFVTYGADLTKLLAWQGVENGIIPQNISDEINNIFRFIKDNKLEKANSLLEDLKKIIDPNHPEINDLQMELDIKELDL